jgi:hypothetical protein
MPFFLFFLQIVQRISDTERRCVRLTEKSKHLEASGESKAEQAARLNEELRSHLLEQKRKKATEVAALCEEDKTCEAIELTMEQEEMEHRRKMAELSQVWRRVEKTVLVHQQALVNNVLANRNYQMPQTHDQFGEHYDAYAATPMATPSSRMATPSSKFSMAPNEAY